MDRIIACVDLDYFYAAVEELRDPSLKGRPVAVCVYSGRDADSGAVATANYPAREFGIRSGIPIKLAQRLDKNKEVVFIARDMDRYRRISDSVMHILRSVADRFEQVSIDEAYLDVTQKAENFKAAERLARTIKREIQEKEGLTCSVGIGPNKLVAKMASGKNKPDGITIVMPQEAKKFIWSFALGKLHGVGPKTEEKLTEMGIDSVKKLAQTRVQELARVFGEHKAHLLHNKALGIDVEPVEDSEKQQLSRLATLAENTRNPEMIMEKITALSKDLEQKVAEQGVTFRTVSLLAITTRLALHTRSSTVAVPRKRVASALPVVRELLDTFLTENPHILLRRCGIKVSGFERAARKKQQKTLGDF